MTPDQITTAANALFNADQTGQQIDLLSLQYPGMTMDDAYAVQAALIALHLSAGRQQIGWKIGLTSRAMQDALKIETPDSGVLLDTMRIENGSTIPAGHFIQPRVEAEIAFVMRSSLAGADCTLDDVIEATDYVAPSLELLDTRVLRSDPKTGQPRVITDTISDNAANAGIVLGEQRHAIDDHDLRWVAAIVSRNDIVEETGLGAGVLNDPITSVLWLARRMAEYGQSIKPGDVILSGSFIRPIEAPSGADINADFGPFGSVQITFD